MPSLWSLFVAVTADTSDYKTKFTDIDQATTQFGRNFEAVDAKLGSAAGFSSAGDKMKEFASAAGGAVPAITQLSDAAQRIVDKNQQVATSIENQRAVLLELQAACARGAASEDDVARAADNLQKTLQRTDPEARAAADAVKKLSQAAQESGGGFDSLLTKIPGVGAVMGILAAGSMAGLLSKLMDLGVAAIQTAEMFEDASVQMQRATGATGADLENMNDSLKRLYGTSSQSAEVIAGAMDTIRQRSGATGAELESLTKSALNFAKVAAVDVKNAVETNQRLFKAWSVDVRDQSLAQDMLYVAQKNTGISVIDLGNALKDAAPLLKSWGFAFEDSLALVAQFAKVTGDDAAGALNALRTAFTKMAEAGKDPKKELTDLISRMEGADNTAQALNMALADGFAIKAALPFVNAVKSGGAELDQLKAKLDNAKGAVDQMAKSTTTLSGEWTKFVHNAQEGAGVLGTVFVKPATDLLQLLNNLESGTASWGTRIKEVIVLLTAMGSGGVTAAANVAKIFNQQYGAGQGSIEKSQNAALLAMQTGENPAEAVAHAFGVGPNSLNTPKPGTGGGTGIDEAGAKKAAAAIREAFSDLGLHDAEKQLADAEAALAKLAASGRLTGEEMLTAATKIAKIRQEIENLQRPTEVASQAIDGLATIFRAAGSPVMGFVGPLQTLPPLVNAIDERMRSLWNLPTTPPWAASIDALVTTSNSATAAESMLRDMTVQVYNEQLVWARNVGIVADAYRTLGIKSADELQSLADKTRDAYNVILADEKSTDELRLEAFKAMMQAKINLERASGVISEEEYRRLQTELNTIDKTGNDTRVKQGKTASDELSKAWTGAFDSLTKGLAQNIVEWKGWGDTIKNFGKSVAEDLLNSFLQGLLKPLKDELANLGSQIGGVFGNIWGSGSGGGGGVLSSIGGAGGGGGAAGGIAGAAGGGIAGLIEGGVSAVSGVISNFQQAGMNKSLDVLVNHTLRIFNVEDQWHTQWFEHDQNMYDRLGEVWNSIREGDKNIFDRLGEINASIREGFGGTGGALAAVAAAAGSGSASGGSRGTAQPAGPTVSDVVAAIGRSNSSSPTGPTIADALKPGSNPVVKAIGDLGNTLRSTPTPVINPVLKSLLEGGIPPRPVPTPIINPVLKSLLEGGLPPVVIPTSLINPTIKSLASHLPSASVPTIPAGLRDGSSSGLPFGMHFSGDMHFHGVNDPKGMADAMRKYYNRKDPVFSRNATTNARS